MGDIFSAGAEADFLHYLRRGLGDDDLPAAVKQHAGVDLFPGRPAADATGGSAAAPADFAPVATTPTILSASSHVSRSPATTVTLIHRLFSISSLPFLKSRPRRGRPSTAVPRELPLQQHPVGRLVRLIQPLPTTDIQQFVRQPVLVRRACPARRRLPGLLDERNQGRRAGTRRRAARKGGEKPLGAPPRGDRTALFLRCTGRQWSERRFAGASRASFPGTRPSECRLPQRGLPGRKPAELPSGGFASRAFR